jgi:hypothetical protein
MQYLLGIISSSKWGALKVVFDKTIPEGSAVMLTMDEKWLQEGRKEGREEGTLEDAKVMIEMGMNNKAIMKITRLELVKIEALRTR